MCDSSGGGTVSCSCFSLPESLVDALWDVVAVDSAYFRNNNLRLRFVCDSSGGETVSVAGVTNFKVIM